MTTQLTLSFLLLLFVNPFAFSANGPDCPSGKCLGPGTTFTSAFGSSFTISGNSFYQSITVTNLSNFTLNAGDTLYVGQKGSTANNFTVSNTSTANINGVLIINGNLTNSGASTINVGGTIIVNGNITNNRLVVPGGIDGMGSVSATGTISNTGAGQTFGSASDCASGPCNSGNCTPVTNTISGTQIICSGGVVIGFTTSAVAGSTYTWYYSTTSANIGFTAVAGGTTQSYTPPTGSISATTYFYRLVTSGSCSYISNIITVSINAFALPTISAIAANPTRCVGQNTLLTGSCSANCGTTTYSWSPNTNLSATTGTSVTASPTSTTTYTVTGTNPTTTCSNTNTVTVTVNPLPVISALAASPAICSGGNTLLTGSCSANCGITTYSWSPNTNLSATTGTSITASPMSTIIYTVTGTNPTTTCNNTNTVTVTVNNATAGQTTWTGTTDNDWSTASNWDCGGVPTTLSDAIIPTGLVKYPELNATGNAKNVSIANGATLTILGSNTLNVSGNLVSNGTFTPNTSTVVFTGNTSAAISGNTTTFYNIKIDKTSAVLSVLSPVILTEKLSFGANTGNALTINNAGSGTFTFSSTSVSTAHVDILTAPLPTITGNYICQKYFPATGGRYNFMIGSPVTTIVSDLQPTAFDVSGYPTDGIYITGPFTGTNTGGGLNDKANSLFNYNPGTGLYSGYPISGGNIASVISQGTGYRLSIRDGGRSVPSVVAKTLSITGTLVAPGAFTYTGLVNGSGTKPFNSGPLPTSTTIGGWNLISNPYMSDISIDLSNATNWPVVSNISNTSYIYNAALRSYSSCASGVGACIISPFQSFFVKANGDPDLTLNETAKVSATNNSILQRVAQADILNFFPISLSCSASDNTDKTYIRYVNGGLPIADELDGFKLGADERNYITDMGIYTKGPDNNFYDVNAKPYNFITDTTVMFVVLPVGEAKLDFSDINNLESGYSISLYDKYNKTITNVNANPVYNFTATEDSNTTGDRFLVIVNRNTVITGINDKTVLSGISIYPSPTNAGNINIKASGLSDNAVLNIYDLAGKLVYTANLNTDDGKVLQNLNLSGLLSTGIYNTTVIADHRIFRQKISIK